MSIVDPCTTAHAKVPVAVLISGSGRTLENFIRLQQRDELPIEIRLVISSHPGVRGLRIAEAAGIPTQLLRRRDAETDDDYSQQIFSACRQAEVQLVFMAGFIKFVPIPPEFAGRVLNIHPSLLPEFGGQGMYGKHVHQAVLQAGANESGCTIHIVDNEYDHGPIVWQHRVPVHSDDTPSSLAERVFEAELIAYPAAVRHYISERMEPRP